MRAQWRMQSRMPWRMQWRAHAEGRMHGRASGNITAGETVNTTGRRARVASVHTSKIILPRPRFLSRPAPVAAERGRPGHGDYGSALTRARDPIAGSRWFGASGPSGPGRTPLHTRDTCGPPDPLLYDISTPIRNLELADSAFTYRTTGTRGGLREVRTSGIR
jgi:hypothetical protein